MQVFEKAVAIILLAAMLFLVPAINSAQTTDQLIQSDVSNTVSSFVDNVCKMGYISQDMYNEFLMRLDDTGYLYDIELIHSHQQVYPVFDTNGNVTSTKTTEETFYSNDILDSIFNSDGIYKMKVDDSFSIAIRSKQKTLGTQMQEAMYDGTISGGKINYSYGNLVRNEKY